MIDVLQRSGLTVDHTMTDNVLMECEKVLYEYEYNTNN